MYPPTGILTVTILKIRTNLISLRAISTHWHVLTFTHIPVEGHVNSRVSSAPSSPVNTVLMHDMCMAVLPPRPYYWPHQHRAPAAIHSVKRPRCQMLTKQLNKESMKINRPFSATAPSTKHSRECQGSDTRLN